MQEWFGVKLEPSIRFVTLYGASLLRLVPGVVGKAIIMLLVALECLLWRRPSLIIDTQGLPFTYPVFSLLFGIPSAAYLHCPYVDPDTLHEKWSFLTGIFGKPYYRFILWLESLCGYAVSLVMTNSTWTHERVISQWSKRLNSKKCQIVYPPCELTKMAQFSLTDREPIIVSLAQFRPEKNQKMQIEILAKLFAMRPEWKGHVRMIILGGCRNSADQARANKLLQFAKNLGLVDCIDVITNASHEEIRHVLSVATIGLHTMPNEHFGINIVEFMAAGPIAVAHRSGGPLCDVVRSDRGFLCNTVEEYAKTIELVLSMPEASRREIREKARTSAVTCFDVSVFERSFIANVTDFIRPLDKGKEKVY